MTEMFSTLGTWNWLIFGLVLMGLQLQPHQHEAEDQPVPGAQRGKHLGHGVALCNFVFALAKMTVRSLSPSNPGLPELANLICRSRIYPTSVGEGWGEGFRSIDRP